jgi:hypothetical protein
MERVVGMLICVQVAMGMPWNSLGTTGPYYHDGPMIAQPLDASFTTTSLANVRQLWEVSTAFPFYWFPMAVGDVEAAIHAIYRRDTEIDAFCSSWMTDVAADQAPPDRTFGCGRHDAASGTVEEGNAMDVDEPDDAPGASRGGGREEGEDVATEPPDFGVVDWMCHTWHLRAAEGFGATWHDGTSAGPSLTSLREKLAAVFKSTLCALKTDIARPRPRIWYLHPHLQPESLPAVRAFAR